MKKSLILIYIILFLIPLSGVWAQQQVYDGPEDGAGDPYLEREGFMVGNRVQQLFKNNTEVGDYPRKDASRWPKGVGGNVMHDGMGMLVTAPVFIINDSIPVTDTLDIATYASQGLLDTLFYCETNYREEMDRDPSGQIEWGFQPAPGYVNVLSETPALSNDPNSWPINGWLYKNRETHWPGEWDGRFGRGQIRSDLECYFVANDAQDLEYLGDDDEVKYYPRPNLRIGDIDPSVTVQYGEPWGGLGIRVKQRGFQWNNPMAQDCIFWEYTVANISDYDLPYMAFGFWLDNDIGGENSGEDGSFVKILNLSYSWDTDGAGEDGYPTGVAGYAYLESPGIYNDGIDNDGDGLIDERRDNDAGQMIGAEDNIVDKEAFFAFYGVEQEDLKPHYEGDEDQDWVDGTDLNQNGVYDGDEYPGDDVGLDGVAPGEENYNGPDADGTECNHKPDLGVGYAEPNFGWTDVSETDMLGLTTLIYTEAIPHTEPYWGWFRNDKSMWERMTWTDSLMSGATNIANMFQLFSTAIFPVRSGQTEFISMSQLHSYEDLAGLNSADHSAPALFTLKKTVQVIYEKDYRFAQPPEMPNLRAIPGDGFVQLIWDNRSDRLTHEPFLNGKNDFEGYKIYRSTDKDMQDPMVITDGYGTKTLFKPIFQCDLKDGRQGFTSYGLLNGMGYNLGSETGLAYSFKDETVQNGRTYFYAVVAYDYGIHPDDLTGSSIVAQDASYGIAPSENNVVIRQNEYEEIEFVGPNVAVVIPGTDAAGTFDATSFELDDSGSRGAGTITPEVIDPNALKPNRTYKIKFKTQKVDSSSRSHPGYGYYYTCNGLEVYDVTGGDRLVFEDILIENEKGILVPKNLHTVIEPDALNEMGVDFDATFYSLAFNEPKQSEIFDGIRLNVLSDVLAAEFDYLNTGWMPGESPMNIAYVEDELQFYRWDYNIVFSDQNIYTGKLENLKSSGIYDETHTRIDRKQILNNLEFPFRVENIAVLDTLGQPELLDLAVWDINESGQFEWLEDRILVGVMNTRGRWDGCLFILDFFAAADESELPQPNDVYAIRHRMPFNETDSILFTVSGEVKVDEELEESDMKDIKVVPNPYVASNVMEPSTVNKFLNQDRRLLFTHLPQECTIKIYIVSGVLVNELNHPEDGLTDYAGWGQGNNGYMHWNMKSFEGLEIAAGMYFYHVKNDNTGQEVSGKFAVLK